MRYRSRVELTRRFMRSPEQVAVPTEINRKSYQMNAIKRGASGPFVSINIIGAKRHENQRDKRQNNNLLSGALPSDSPVNVCLFVLT